MMKLIIWLVVGTLAGFLASKILNQDGGLLLDMGLGIVGGFVGGFLFKLLGFNGRGLIYHIVVATAGAVVVIVLYNKFMR
jgi:uncharacterized membrane protein YeaQ/YmgE (transglycosylase-associated protein family)